MDLFVLFDNFLHPSDFDKLFSLFDVFLHDLPLLLHHFQVLKLFKLTPAHDLFSQLFELIFLLGIL
jgi:hypothetical protein